MKYCPSCQASYPHDYTACPKDQTSLQPVTDLIPGMVLRGKYEILDKLGAGGMGAVYKARHVAFDELCAIKFVGAHLLEDERALLRFRAEAVVARRLQHPNAVKVQDLDTTDDGRPFIVMEYVQGRSLRELFRDERDVPTKRILALAREACGALGAAHALGIVHRDIKPDNLMIVSGADGSESLKVADFGLAKVREGFELASDKAFTQTGFILGTPPYMSPEQASGADLDGRSDLYSLGIVLYEMLTGRLPFRADSPLGMLIHHRETPPPPPTALGIPQAMAAVLMKSLAKRPEDRYQSAAQMDEALRQLGLLSLPEFVGQGISEGFDPQWVGSRHASRMTTLKAAPAPARTLVQSRPGPRPPMGRSRPVSPPVGEESEPERSGSKGWIGLVAFALVAVWFLQRPSPPPPVPSPANVPVQAPQTFSPIESAPESARPPERSDNMIRFDIEGLLSNSTALRAASIRVEVANGVVTLMGDAPNQTTAELAMSLAASVSGVRRVFSALQGPADPATEGAAANATAQGSPAAAPAPQEEPSRATPPGGEDPTREQIRVLLDRARVKMEARNPEGARLELEAVLTLDPNHAFAKQALERIKNRPQGSPGAGPRPTPRG